MVAHGDANVHIKGVRITIALGKVTAKELATLRKLFRTPHTFALGTAIFTRHKQGISLSARDVCKDLDFQKTPPPEDEGSNIKYKSWESFLDEDAEAFYSMFKHAKQRLQRHEMILRTARFKRPVKGLGK